jgi:hypothetical protein
VGPRRADRGLLQSGRRLGPPRRGNGHPHRRGHGAQGRLERRREGPAGIRRRREPARCGPRWRRARPRRPRPIPGEGARGQGREAARDGGHHGRDPGPQRRAGGAGGQAAGRGALLRDAARTRQGGPPARPRHPAEGMGPDRGRPRYDQPAHRDGAAGDLGRGGPAGEGQRGGGRRTGDRGADATRRHRRDRGGDSGSGVLRDLLPGAGRALGGALRRGPRYRRGRREAVVEARAPGDRGAGIGRGLGRRTPHHRDGDAQPQPPDGPHHPAAHLDREAGQSGGLRASRDGEVGPAAPHAGATVRDPGRVGPEPRYGGEPPGTGTARQISDGRHGDAGRRASGRRGDARGVARLLHAEPHHRYGGRRPSGPAPRGGAHRRCGSTSPRG